MHKSIVIIFLLISLHYVSLAQDTLPKVSVTRLGNKVLISWINPYNSVTVINIQRSYDSIKYFRTIGSVLNVSAKNNGFVDAQELPPPVYYRIFISFEGGSYIFTQSHRPVLDTSKTVEEIKDVTEVVQPPPVPTSFIPSKYIYTGKENNVIISLPNVDTKKYSIKFFEENGTPLFEIKKVSEGYLTLDKVNFLHAGLFNFEIYADGTLFEKHKVYIPKDGKPMPALDFEGHEK